MTRGFHLMRTFHRQMFLFQHLTMQRHGQYRMGTTGHRIHVGRRRGSFGRTLGQKGRKTGFVRDGFLHQTSHVHGAIFVFSNGQFGFLFHNSRVAAVVFITCTVAAKSGGTKVVVGTGGQQITQFFVVDFHKRREDSVVGNVLCFFMANFGKDRGNGSWNDALGRSSGSVVRRAHGVRLSTSSLSIGQEGRIETVEQTIFQTFHTRVVDVVLGGVLTKGVVKGKGTVGIVVGDHLVGVGVDGEHGFAPLRSFRRDQRPDAYGDFDGEVGHVLVVRCAWRPGGGVGGE